MPTTLETTRSAENLPPEPFAHQEIVSYDGAKTALRFQQPARIEWGGHKHAEEPELGNTKALVTTESGETYLVANGMLINPESGRFVGLERLAEQQGMSLPDITIGEAWNVPGVFESDKVTSVLLPYKVGGNASEHIPQESPFDAYEEVIKNAQEKFEKGERRRKKVAKGLGKIGLAMSAMKRGLNHFKTSVRQIAEAFSQPAETPEQIVAHSHTSERTLVSVSSHSGTPSSSERPERNSFENHDSEAVDSKTQQLRSAVNGMANFAAALAKDRSNDSSPHSKNTLPKPLQTNFGVFTTKYEYVDQVNPDDQLSPTEKLIEPVGIVVVELEMADGKKRTVQIGKRDATEHVLKGFSQKYHDASPDGDHVIYIEDENGVIPIVLDKTELPSLIKPGQPLNFGKDNKRTISGTITNIVSYK